MNEWLILILIFILFKKLQLQIVFKLHVITEKQGNASALEF